MIGTTLSHYRIVEQIGAGGMGVVYRAHDERLNRDVAIKVLPEEVAQDPDRLARFEREAKAIAQLSHPNVLAIFELGAHEGAPFIVTELLDGQSLREMINQGRLPLRSVTDYATQIASGLAAAHDRGVVHRDLKPGNIFVTSDGHLKILDFGLAKLREPEEDLATETPTATLMTSPGTVVGTVAYMAPEQVSGQPADHRTDIFALGVILYEMLAGKRPFRGTTAAETTAAILRDEPEPLSAVSSTAPPGLSSIVSRCLEKDPKDRFRSAHDLSLAIQAQSDVPAISAVATPGFRTRRWKPGFVVAAVGAAVAIVVVLYLGTREAEPAPGIGPSGRPAVAVMRFEDHTESEDSAWLAGGLPSMLLTGLAQTQGLDVISGERIQEVLKQLGQGDIEDLDPALVPETARRAGAGAVVVGSFYTSGPEVRIDVQIQDVGSNKLLSAHTVQGEDVFPLVDELTEHIRASLALADAPAGLDIAEVTTSSIEAYRLYQEGREAQSMARFVDAIGLFEQAIELDPSFALAHFRMWMIHSGHGNRPDPDADPYRQKTLEHISSMSERQRLWVLSILAREAGNSPRAAELLEQLIARYPDEAGAYPVLAWIYEWGVYDSEMFLDTHARGVMAHPGSGRMRGGYAQALLFAGRFQEARREAEAFIELNPRDALPHNWMGDYYMVVGEPEKALEEYARAIEIDPSFGRARSGLALAHAMRGHYDEALQESNRYSLFQDDLLKAFLLSRAGRYQEAEQTILEGMRDAESPPYVLYVQQNLDWMRATIAIERGQLPRAIDATDHMLETIPRISTLEIRESVGQAAHARAGIAHARSGNRERARHHLDTLRTLLREPHWRLIDWLLVALAGEIELAAGDLDAAEETFRNGEPNPTMMFHRNPVGVAIFFHHSPSHDGLARVARARGDLDAAIAEYRRLNTPGIDCPWTSVLEPRYVLELARLFDEKGDESTAREHYQQFLELWKNADPDLPELAEARTRLAQLESQEP